MKTLASVFSTLLVSILFPAFIATVASATVPANYFEPEKINLGATSNISNKDILIQDGSDLYQLDNLTGQDTPKTLIKRDLAGNVVFSTPIVTASNLSIYNYEFPPDMVHDSTGSYIVLYRLISSGNYGYWVQKISNTGTKLWGDDGVAAVTGASGAVNKKIIPDGQGGAYIAWSNSVANIFVQRITSDGTLAWGSPVSLASETSFTQMHTYTIANDGVGGFIVTFTGTGSPNGIYAMRLDASGTKLWGVNGIMLSNGAGAGPLVVQKGGSIYFSYKYTANQNVMVNKLGLDGTKYWGDWGALAVTLNATTRDMYVDNSGNVYLFNMAAAEMRVQKMNSSGVAQLGASGVVISMAGVPGRMAYASDGSFWVAWSHNSLNTMWKQTYIMHFSAAGVPEWPLADALLTKSYTTEGEYIHGLAVDTDGNALIVGNSVIISQNQPYTHFQKIAPGYVVQNLSSSILALFSSGKSATTTAVPENQSRVITLQDVTTGAVLGTATAQFPTNLNWSGITGEVDVANNMVYLAGLYTADGVTDMTLNVPLAPANNGVLVCPGAEAFVDIVEGCSGGYNLTLADTEVTESSILFGPPTGQTTTTDDMTADIYDGAGHFENWTTSGNALWIPDTTKYNSAPGSYSSGDINDSQTSRLQLVRNFPTGGSLSYYWSVSSESGWDKLTFCIDGSNCQNISGTVAWTQVSVNVTAGEHTFSWEYAKDSSGSTGSDMGWVDDVVATDVEYGTQKFWSISGITGTGALGITNPINNVALPLKDEMSRLKVATASDHHIYFGASEALDDSTDSFVLTFDAGGLAFDLGSVSDLDMDLLADTVPLTLGSGAGVNTWGVLVNTTNDTITFNAPSSGTGYITQGQAIEVLIGLNAAGATNQITNPAIPGNYHILVDLNYNTGTDSGDIAVPIVDSDEVNVTGFVNTFINFDIDTAVTDADCTYDACLTHENGSAGTNYTVDLGEMNSTWVNKSNSVAVQHVLGGSGIINSIYFDLTTNAYGGAILYVTSANSGLQGPGSNLIASVTTDGDDIAANSGLYGFQLPVAGTGNGTVDRGTACISGVDYCALTSTANVVFDTEGAPLDGGRLRMDLAAAAAYTNNPGNYTDTLTFVVVPTY